MNIIDELENMSDELEVMAVEADHLKSKLRGLSWYVAKEKYKAERTENDTKTNSQTQNGYPAV